MDRDLYSRLAPWGNEFGEKRNFEAGYAVTEKRLVSKYLSEPESILIIGAGNGREARPIGGRGHIIFCIDIGEFYLISGSYYCRKEGLENVFFLKSDCRRLPFRPGNLGFVFFSIYSVLGDLRLEVLSEVRNSLRLEGFVLLTVATPKYLEMYPGLQNLHIIEDETQLEQEVNRVGFDLLESEVDLLRPEYRMAVLRNTIGKTWAAQ